MSTDENIKTCVKEALDAMIRANGARAVETAEPTNKRAPGGIPKAPGEKLEQHTFSANDLDYQTIKEAARELHLDFSSFVRVAVMDYIKRKKIEELSEGGTE